MSAYFYENPGHGYYLMIGSLDAQEGADRKTLIAPNDIYQADYDEGYSMGQWIEVYTEQQWM